MRVKLENEGSYELFRTTKGHQILSLNGKNWFAVVKGQKGDILVHSDSDHQKEKTLKKGKFYLADFEDDPEFRDMPHLFLQEGDKYREWILPNNAPSEKDYQKKLVKTGKLVLKSKVEEHTKGRGDSGSEKQYKGRKENLYTKTKNELYRLAQKREIPGRSKLNKDQLVKRLAKA